MAHILIIKNGALFKQNAKNFHAKNPFLSNPYEKNKKLSQRKHSAYIIFFSKHHFIQTPATALWICCCCAFAWTNMTFVMNLTTAEAGCSGSSSAKTWHVFSSEDGDFLATNPNIGALRMYVGGNCEALLLSNLKNGK